MAGMCQIFQKFFDSQNGQIVSKCKATRFLDHDGHVLFVINFYVQIYLNLLPLLDLLRDRHMCLALLCWPGLFTCFHFLLG